MHLVKKLAANTWQYEVEDVILLDNGFYLFKCTNDSACISILNFESFQVLEKLMIFKRWNPGMPLKKKKNNFSSIPMWVKFFNVPMALWTPEGLGYLASIIVTPQT